MQRLAQAAATVAIVVSILVITGVIDETYIFVFLTSHQAELEVIQTTAIAIVIRFAALVLVLALAHALVRLYDRGLQLSIQYDGIADSLLLAPKALPLDLEQLRRILTPVDALAPGPKVPALE